MNTKRNWGIIIIYSFGFLAVTLVELLTINESFGGATTSVRLDFAGIVKKLPSLLTSYFAIICYTIATLQSDIAKFKLTNPFYLDTENKINGFAKTSYRPTLFNKFSYIANKKRKEKAWKNKIIKMWNALENKQTDKDFAEWTDYQSRKKADPHTIVPNNKYIIKRLKLERYLDEVFIKENIDRLPVKYDSINAGLVLGGIKSNSLELEEDEYITKNKIGIVFWDRVPSTFTMLAIVSMITSITVDAFSIQAHWAVWILFIFKLITKIYSLINTIHGMHKYAVFYNEKVTLKDIRFRFGVICEYEAWVKKELKQLNLKKEEELEHVTTNTTEQISKPIDGRQVNIIRAEPNIDTSENQRNSIVDEENNMQHPVLVSTDGQEL